VTIGRSQQAAEGEDDPVDQLSKAPAMNSKKPIKNPGLAKCRLPIFLAHFSEDARQALEIGLGEALRIVILAGS